MKNLFTLLLLVISLLAFGQSNSQSLEVEIKYWKSIAESNDTVAYREYLQRYGEDGLYKDEALTRITLLKTSGKQTQSKSAECFFYSQYTGPSNVKYVVRFNGDKGKVWFKGVRYDTVRSNLSISRDFYEDQATIALSRGTWEYKDAIRNDKKAIEEAEYANKYEKNRRKKSEILQKAEQAKSPEYYENAWTADEEYEYDPMKSTSSRDVYFKRDELHQINFFHEEYVRNEGYCITKRQIIYVYLDDILSEFCVRDYFSEYFSRNDRQLNWGYDHYNKTKTMQGFRYIAFSKDKSSIIMWFEENNNLDGKIYDKRDYSRIPKEDLLPKAVNYDFLNE